MEMVLRRIAKKQDYTIGWLYLNRGEKKFCDTLEPPALEKKTSVAKEVVLRSKKKAQALKPFAIPEGRYAVVITFSPKKKKWLPEGGHGTELQRLGGTIEKEDRGSQRQG